MAQSQGEVALIGQIQQRLGHIPTTLFINYWIIYAILVLEWELPTVILILILPIGKLLGMFVMLISLLILVQTKLI